MSRSAAAVPLAPGPGNAVPPTERYVSEAEYWAEFYDLDDVSYEWNNGFDLCIEALSDATRAGRLRDQVTKRDEYAQAGVREYWILHHQPGRLALFSRGSDGLYRPLPVVDGVVRSAVLPGFAFRVGDLLTRPPIDRLRHDPVYQGFVYPAWRALEEAQALVEQARVQAEQQRQHAEQERDALRRSRQASIERLARLGLTPAQIAGALDLPLAQVIADAGGDSGGDAGSNQVEPE